MFYCIFRVTMIHVIKLYRMHCIKRLAAAMIVHNVTHILTFNVTDFQRYADKGIEVVNPAAV